MQVDSIADTVVVHNGGGSPLSADLELVPELRIGEQDGADAYMFGAIGVVRPSGDGGVYVYDGLAVAIRQYSSSGTYLGDIGGPGDGPGEFRGIAGLVPLRDGRLVAWDPYRRRGLVFDSAGTPVTSWSAPGNWLVVSRPALYADSNDVLYLTTRAAPSGAPSGSAAASAERQRVSFIRLDVDGRIRDTVSVPESGLVEAWLVAHGGMRLRDRVPFSAAFVWDVLPTGEILTARGDEYVLRLYGADGRVRQIRREAAAVPVSAEEWADAERWIRESMRLAQPDWEWRAAPIPAAKPYIRQLLAGVDGSIWVQRFLPGHRLTDEQVEARDAAAHPMFRGRIAPRQWTERTGYDVFDPAGRFIGFVLVPDGAVLSSVARDHAWGYVRDEDDVPSVVRWRVSRTR